MEREQLLSELTYKDDHNLSVERRVYYTLNKEVNGAQFSPIRTQRLLSLLIAHLDAKGLISESELDTMLLGAIDKLD